MRHAYQRLAALIAASGLRESEIHEFVTLLRRMGPKRFVHDIVRIRRALRDLPMMLEFVEPVYRGMSGTTLDKVSQLLLDEAGLSRAEAVRRLTQAIMEKYPNATVPPESRKGFASWLERLAEGISQSDLLHLATQIRNSLVHRATPDWRLKG
jgi:hypothetical protein